MRARPPWFSGALATPYEEGAIEADGCPVHYLDWGGAGRPGLVLLHGGAAHAHWWSFLAPFFTHHWHPVAMDLSGHGDSGRREAYSMEKWGAEVAVLIDRVGFAAPPVIVGHSLGGIVALQVAADYCPSVAGVVMVDSAVYPPEQQPSLSRRRAFQDPGTYPTEEEALVHFRLVPDQPPVPEYILDHIARHSVHAEGGGWTWKFDPRVFSQPRPYMGERLAATRCRLALIHGERSAILTPETAAYMSAVTEGRVPIIAIPDAHHHLLLDHPLAFVSALRALLLAWEQCPPA